MARPEAARRRAHADRWLWAGALAVAAWAILYPLPYGLCILVLAGGALTFLALCFARPRRFPLLKKNGMLGTASQLAMILSMILAIRALLDFNLVDWVAPLIAAISVALLLAGLAAAAMRRAEPPLGRGKTSGGVVAFLFMGLGLGWGVTVEANVLFDRSEPAVFRLQVERKWIVRGRSMRHHVQLGPRVEALGGGDFAVGPDVYSRAAVGSTLCVQVRPGLLGIRWYEVTTCEASVI